MKYFFAQCYQHRDGSRTSLVENINSIVLIRAASEREAWDILAERESDCEIPLDERWRMNPIEEEFYTHAGSHVPKLS